MSNLKYVTMEKDGLRGEVTEESVAAWERNGWTRVEDGNSESGAEPVAEAPVAPVNEVPVAPVPVDDGQAVQNEGGVQ